MGAPFAELGTFGSRPCTAQLGFTVHALPGEQFWAYGTAAGLLACCHQVRCGAQQAQRPARMRAAVILHACMAGAQRGAALSAAWACWTQPAADGPPGQRASRLPGRAADRAGPAGGSLRPPGHRARPGQVIPAQPPAAAERPDASSMCSFMPWLTISGSMSKPRCPEQTADCPRSKPPCSSPLAGCAAT